MFNSLRPFRFPAGASAVGLLTLVASVTILAAGCNSNSLALVPVSGTVTFDGSPPPDVGTIMFRPDKVADGFPNRAGRGQFSSDGKFVVTSFQKGDGIAPGEYTVEVTCYSGAPNLNSKDPFGDVSYIDKSYEPAKLVVEPGSDAMEVTFDVPLKKKA